MRIHVAGAVIVLSLCVVPFDAAAQSVCAKPWAIADKWIDNHDETEPIDNIWTPDDTFETLDAHGGLLSDADVYIPPNGGPAFTGFTIGDVGSQLWLKVGDAGAATQGWFFAVDIGGAGAGASAYKDAIAICDPAAPTVVLVGETLTPLKGNLHGPTIQGVMELISQDPNAYWDVVNGRVGGSCANSETPCAPFSPRLAAIGVFDPALFEESSRGSGTPQLAVSNVVGVFVEGYYNGYVIGRLTPVPMH
jgi:hypothetical protein